MEKYTSGRYSKLEFLSAVSHCTDTMETLSEKNSDTEEYSWDESIADDSTDSVHSHSNAIHLLHQLSTASCFGFDVIR